jgi:hypothetical protein
VLWRAELGHNAKLLHLGERVDLTPMLNKLPILDSVYGSCSHVEFPTSGWDTTKLFSKVAIST